MEPAPSSSGYREKRQLQVLWRHLIEGITEYNYGWKVIRSNVAVSDGRKMTAGGQSFSSLRMTQNLARGQGAE
jgi:hypothetical protein